MNVIDILKPLRQHAGTVRTPGLDDASLQRLAGRFPELVEAAKAAVEAYEAITAEFADLLELDEQAQVEAVQGNFVNFYPDDAVNPYVALAARGPWVVTLKGAVIHDSGGYGMLGLGHTPKALLAAMSRPQVMANIMTPSLSQLRVARALRKAGLPVGPGRTLDAVNAVAAAGFDRREDFYFTLQAIFVSRPEERSLFAQVFRLFWRDPRYLEHMMSLMIPAVRGTQEDRIADAAEKRAAEALLDKLQALFPERLYIEIARRGNAGEQAAERALVDLAYAIGESHALRQVCQGDGDQYWRERMEQLGHAPWADDDRTG